MPYDSKLDIQPTNYNMRGNKEGKSNDSLETPDKGDTSDIHGLASGYLRKQNKTNKQKPIQQRQQTTNVCTHILV